MSPGRLQIGVQRGDQPSQALLEIRVLGERDPVAVPDFGRKLGVGHRLTQDGQDPLLHLPGVLDLVLAVSRVHRVRRDHEQERVRLFDRPLDHLGEHLAILDPLVSSHTSLPPRSDTASVSRRTNSESRRE